MLKKLKIIRKKRGYSITNMATMLNISIPFYSQLENEKRKISYFMAVKISKILNKKPDDIFYEEFIKRI